MSMDLNITEIFASVQGETSLSGLPTTFIRLAACNLRCTWCDTSYSFSRGTPYALERIIETVVENRHSHVCVTGGEPLLQKNVYPLMTALCDRDYCVSLETGGSLDISAVDPRVVTILDVKCPGSGMSHKNLWSNLERLKDADEVKFVLKDEEDYRFAVETALKYELFGRQKPVLFSPVFEALNPRELVGWILRDKLPVRLNLQTHKYIWTPNTQGV